MEQKSRHWEQKRPKMRPMGSENFHWERGKKNGCKKIWNPRLPHAIFVLIEHCGFDKLIMRMEKKIWLVTTDHLEDGLWFPEEADFKTGMNYVAVLAAEGSVFVLAFILMSNHVHFVLYGTREDVMWFINEFKRRHSKYLQKKYGTGKLLKNNAVDIREIPEEGEAVERAVAYVHMNCVAANICSYPTQYSWGSGDVFFNSVNPRGIRIDSMSERSRYRMLHSKADLPGNWLVGDDGFILPSSYVKKAYVENVFHSPKRMDYFLRTSSKARVWVDSGEKSMPAFKDQVIASAVPDLCRTMFQKGSYGELSDAQKSEMLRQLRYRFSSNIHQLARVTGLSYDAAARLMDSHLV